MVSERGSRKYSCSSDGSLGAVEFGERIILLFCILEVTIWKEKITICVALELAYVLFQTLAHLSSRVDKKTRKTLKSTESYYFDLLNVKQ